MQQELINHPEVNGCAIIGNIARNIINKNIIPKLRGEYQKSFAGGEVSVTGIELKGKAGKYSSCYYKSRRKVFEKISEVLKAKIIPTGSHGRLILVVMHENDEKFSEYFGEGIKFKGERSKL